MIDEKGISEDYAIDLPSARIARLSDTISRIKYKEFDEEFDRENAKTHTETLRKVQDGKPCYVIINFLNSNVLITNDARDYFAHDERHTRLLLAQAIVIDGLAQKIVANFYKNFHDPDCPVELFSNETDAIEWIQSLQE